MRKLIVSGTTHELSEDLITIGRSPENLVQIDDQSVSGRHAELRLVSGTYHLKDLGSTNGTRINGAPLMDATLRGGERIRFGGIDARYETDTPSAAQPLPVATIARAIPAEESLRPVDFTNASPFPDRRKTKDPARTYVIAAAAVALLAFAGSMVVVLLMHAPAR
ncbi:MAG: FHA domain-containing protein [Chthoniobacterales bacterium]